jgi:hypothetical protein
LEVYAQQAKNFEAEQEAAKIRIRAERRAGELLKETKNNGARASANGNLKKRPEVANSRRPRHYPRPVVEVAEARGSPGGWVRGRDFKAGYEADNRRDFGGPLFERIYGMAHAV